MFVGIHFFIVADNLAACLDQRIASGT